MSSLNLMKVKIFGQKRSGINLTQHLLQKIPGAVILKDPWKHGPPSVVGDYQVLIGKQKHAWVDSMLRYEQPACEPLHDISGWEDREEAYMRFALENPTTALYLSYEAMMADPEAAWGRITTLLQVDTPFPGMPKKTMGFSGDELSVDYRPGNVIRGLHLR